MSIQEDIKAIWQEGMNRDNENKAYFDAMVTILEKMEGQKVTRRIATAFQKQFPDLVVHWKTDFSFELLFRGDGIEYGKRKQFFFGSSDKPRFISVEDFKERNIAYGQAVEERNAGRLKFMADENWLNTVAKEITIYRRVKESLDNLIGDTSLDTPDRHYVAEYLGLDK